jgi:hypothetical protein
LWIHRKLFYLYVLVVYEACGLHCDTVLYGWWSQPRRRPSNSPYSFWGPNVYRSPPPPHHLLAR